MLHEHVRPTFFFALILLGSRSRKEQKSSSWKLNFVIEKKALSLETSFFSYQKKNKSGAQKYFRLKLQIQTQA